MKLTEFFKLKKPDGDDFYDVQDFNSNADVVDNELKKQSDRIKATESPAFTEAEKDENIQSNESLPTLLGKIKRAITKISEHISADNPHSGSAPKKHKHSTDDMESGILPLSRGGTGATTAAGVRNALGLGNTTGPTPIANGGTGANTAAQALKNLGITVAATVVNLLNGLTENIVEALDKKSDKDHKHDASDTTSGTFSVNRIPNLAISKITNLQEKLNAKQNNLGFTPVQQGSYEKFGLLANKIYVGWDGKKLRAVVDETDMGDIVTTGSANNTELPMSKVDGLTDFALTVVGLTAQFLSYRKSLKIEPKGGVGHVYFKKGSCGFLSSVYNNSSTQVGLWHFSSGSNAVSVVPVIPNSNYEVTGSFLDDEIELTIKNNLTTKEQRFAAILIFNPEFTD